MALEDNAGEAPGLDPGRAPMEMERSTAVRKLATLWLAEQLRAEFLSVDELASRNRALDSEMGDLERLSVTEDELNRALAECIERIGDVMRFMYKGWPLSRPNSAGKD